MCFLPGDPPPPCVRLLAGPLAIPRGRGLANAGDPSCHNCFFSRGTATKSNPAGTPRSGLPRGLELGVITGLVGASRSGVHRALEMGRSGPGEDRLAGEPATFGSSPSNTALEKRQPRQLYWFSQSWAFPRLQIPP